MLTEEAVIAAAKVGGAAALGSAVALKWMPGNVWQKSFSFLGSMGIGCLVGGMAVERFAIPPGSYTHMLAIASAAVFGLAFVNHVMLQIPEWMIAARKKILGS